MQPILCGCPQVRNLPAMLPKGLYGHPGWPLPLSLIHIFVPGTPYEKAVLLDVDTATPEYRAFEKQLYTQALRDLGFQDVYKRQGQPHTVTVSDLSEAGVTTAIRYGHSADACTLTSAPNYTEAGDYPVYYEITYTYHDTDMVEDGVAYVHLRDETTTEDGSCSCGCGNPDCGCQDPDCDGCCCDDKGCGENHNWTLLDSVDPTCLTLGYDRYLCVDCGMIEKRD